MLTVATEPFEELREGAPADEADDMEVTDVWNMCEYTVKFVKVSQRSSTAHNQNRPADALALEYAVTLTLAEESTLDAEEARGRLREGPPGNEPDEDIAVVSVYMCVSDYEGIHTLTSTDLQLRCY